MHKKLPIISIMLLVGFITPMLVFGASRFPKPTIVDDTLQPTQVKIHWEKQSKVKRYQLRLFNSDCSNRIKKYKISKHKTHKVIKALTADTKYCIKMRAKYKDGTHDRFSNPRRFTTTANAIVATPLQLGVNFIPYFSTENAALSEATQPTAIEATFTDLGIGTFRQMTGSDLIWSNVSAANNQFDFTTEDAVLTTTTHEPIVTLFSYQFAEGTSPEDELMGDTTPEKNLTAEQETYIGTVVDRYKADVTYWEIGNELAHWESDYPGQFTPEEQGAWLAAVSAVIKEHDPEAKVVLPGLINITTDNTDDWLTGVIAGGGTEWFDIVGYHYYNRWQAFEEARSALQTTLVNLGIADKPVWLTETGATSDVTLTNKTNYPNSTTEQAADVFRRIIPSYAAGDEVAIWHTLLGNTETDNNFRYFGLLDGSLNKKPAYYSLQLLSTEILPFNTVEKQTDYVYQITKTDGAIYYVAWSATADNMAIPTGITQYTSVVPNDDGSFNWIDVDPGDTVNLNTIPILLR